MRSHYCGQVNESLIGQEIGVAGWVHRRRDHGGVIFVDLRDREGIVQIVFDPDRAGTFATAEKLRSEYCVAETVRLTHRVLDLRRAQMQKNLMLRYRTSMAARKALDALGFIDIETPVLYKSTPEGAREFLVPSRMHHGMFYALPQSPQLFKQMLMIAGFDRYYQIVKCYRDEDARADRQLEFTQIDIETSFLDEAEIRSLMEGLARHMFKEVLGVALPDPFPVMAYEDAMRDYGVDKPDLRVPLKLAELTDIVKDVDFKVFSGPA